MDGKTEAGGEIDSSKFCPPTDLTHASSTVSEPLLHGDIRIIRFTTTEPPSVVRVLFDMQQLEKAATARSFNEEAQEQLRGRVRASATRTTDD